MSERKISSTTAANGRSQLTGKQAAFVNAYLGEARFNASRAARVAGYRATSKHSFEQIGHENLTKPQIRATIDEHFKLSRMSSEECLVELSNLARGDSKDKVRALALLSSHFGLLDGAGAASARGNGNDLQREREIGGRVEAAILQVYGDMDAQVETFNRAAEKNNQRIEKAWRTLLERYKDFPEAVEALTLLHDVVYAKTIGDNLTEGQTVEVVEIIPPQRYLQPAPIERMMRTLDTETQVDAQLPAPQAVAPDADYTEVQWWDKTIRIKNEIRRE